MHPLFKVLIIASCLSMSHADMKCSWGEENIVDRIFSTCPGIGDSSDMGYCCIDTHGRPKCCPLIEFALTYIIIAVVVLVIISLLCCLVSCFCCPCCFCYKRRNASPI